MADEKSCCCCCGGGEPKVQDKSCCCEQGVSEEFLATLDEDARALILDDSTAPELVSSGSEVFSQLDRHELTPWTRALWELYKELIRATIDGGWDNATHPWNRDMQDFWKYPLAFTSYGLPSLVMIDPSTYEDVCEILRKSLLLMKDAGAFDEWTRLEFGKDPVTTKNVMYKGHLNLMYGIYRLLSGSTEFDVEYHHLMGIIRLENLNNSREGFWGIECEPDQWFTPCNSIAMMSEVFYDLNFGTNYTDEIGRPTAEFIKRKMIDPESGLTLFRYHPSCDYAEPYTIGDCWAAAMLNWWMPEEDARNYASIKREFVAEIKGGTECYLKANRYTFGASTDYEQSTWVLYAPFLTREMGDVTTWEKFTRFFCDPIVRMLGATPDIQADAVAAVRIFVAFFPLTIVGQMLCSVLRVDEKPRAAAIVQIVSSVIAIAYLYFSTFIAGWGVPGAGIYWGLTIGIWAAAAWWFVGEGTGKSSLKIRFSDMGFDAELTKSFVMIGFPYFALQVASSVYTAVVNNRLAALGSSMDLAVFAIINGYIIYVLMLFVAALTFATQAIASFNNDAKNWGRLAELVRLQLVYEVVFMAACSAVVLLIPRQICSMFAMGDTALVDAAVPAVRLVVALCALGYTGQMMSSYFECVERVGEAVVCGIALYVIFTIPLVYLLGATMGVSGVWWGQLAANVLTGMLSLVLARRELQRLHELEAA